SIYHQIICLCLHAFKHSYKPLMLLCDINEFLRVEKEKIDWDILVEEAFKFGLSRYVYYGLYLTSRIFNTDIPAQAINQLKPKRMSLFERKHINSILQGRPIFRDKYSIFLVYLGMHETLTERFVFLHNVLFPCRKYLSFMRGGKTSPTGIREYIRRANIGFNCITKFLYYAARKPRP
ncbi:MAG: nucleotidyltransferase family protein, partial [Candidatus Omnitrophota bacterium]|nr:nucleotidyltransferase family protein [Candidatus Omnitrophota bacterium]